jgi:spore maturation protein CgeB
MNLDRLDIVVLGLSITSSWGNGHAATYRALLRAMAARGHHVLFLERDVPSYAQNRDLPEPSFCDTSLYTNLNDLQTRFGDRVRNADAVIVGSYVPEGVAVAGWVLEHARGLAAFYDIDTPITLAKLAARDYEYLRPELIPRFHLYLSFAGGAVLRQLERQYGAPAARPLYCCVDPELYRPLPPSTSWDLGYLGTYSKDRQPTLEQLLLKPARVWPAGRFVASGPQYPQSLRWPLNVNRIEHLPPAEHARFYSAQRFTLNITRADMIRAGYCPSVRLFEAAACATPILSDGWPGLDAFFVIGSEIIVVCSTGQVLRLLRELSDTDRLALGQRARQRVLRAHTAAHRAAELETHLCERLTQPDSSLFASVPDSFEPRRPAKRALHGLEAADG